MSILPESTCHRLEAPSEEASAGEDGTGEQEPIPKPAGKAAGRGWRDAHASSLAPRCCRA